jgi:hypothetical protein
MIVNAWMSVENFPESSGEQKANFSDDMNNIADGLEVISLPLTACHARRLAKAVHTLKEAHELRSLYYELENRFNDELESVKFFLVDKLRMTYFDNTLLAGEQFKANFPRGNMELIEAGNCFTLDRYTACVFHLMRALDICLTRLESSLGIPRPAKDGEKTWGKTLGRIRDKISANDKTPPVNWGNDRPFYEQAYAFLSAVKSPFRDDTMHVESSYDAQSAADVYNVVVTVLRHLASKLAE